MNRYDLKGRVAVITGGAGGIGSIVARLMIESGARVVLWDQPGAIDAAVTALGPQATGRAVDITDRAAIDASLAAIDGRIDILVNNAGVLGEVKPIWETDPDDFARVMAVNLTGTYLVTRAVVARMRGQAPMPARGRIVNLSSTQGKEGMPQAVAYSASKAAVMALTKTVAKETARDAIHVTCVAPTAAETAMSRQITPERRAEIMARIPTGRFVEVEEIARMIVWLCTEDCSFSTGAIFDLSGGRATY